LKNPPGADFSVEQAKRRPGDQESAARRQLLGRLDCNGLDIDGSGLVDMGDLLVVLGNWTVWGRSSSLPDGVEACAIVLTLV
jgi:hypothetical protein